MIWTGKNTACWWVRQLTQPLTSACASAPSSSVRKMEESRPLSWLWLQLLGPPMACCLRLSGYHYGSANLPSATALATRLMELPVSLNGRQRVARERAQARPVKKEAIPWSASMARMASGTHSKNCHCSIVKHQSCKALLHVWSKGVCLWRRRDAKWSGSILDRHYEVGKRQQWDSLQRTGLLCTDMPLDTNQQCFSGKDLLLHGSTETIRPGTEWAWKRLRHWSVSTQLWRWKRSVVNFKDTDKMLAEMHVKIRSASQNISYINFCSCSRYTPFLALVPGIITASCGSKTGIWALRTSTNPAADGIRYKWRKFGIRGAVYEVSISTPNHLFGIGGNS